MPSRTREDALEPLEEPRKARSSAMFEDAVMLLKILQLIPLRQWTTIPQIATQLENEGLDIRRRTLQRYLQTIRQHPEIFPIAFDLDAKPYRFRWDMHSKGLHLPLLSVQDTLLLRLAEEHLRYQLPPSVLAGLRPLFHDAKHIAALNAEKREYSWLRKVKVVSPSLSFMPPKINPQVFERTSEALFADKRLFVRYRNARGKRVEAYVMPLALVQQDVRTYLVCQFEGYSNFRHLALHRIESARVTTFDFERPADFDLEDYTARAPFNYAQGRTIRLEILTDDPVLVKNLAETPFNRTQTIVKEKLERSSEEDSQPNPQRTADALRWRITVDIEDSLLLDGWLAMRRASILSTKKTLLKTNDAHEKPAKPAKRITEKALDTDERCSTVNSNHRTETRERTVPASEPTIASPENALRSAQAAFAPERYASKVMTPEEKREQLAENDLQKEQERERPRDSLFVLERQIVQQASD